MKRPPNDKRAARGIALLALLLTLALMSIALLGEVEWWSAARQREAEADLMYVGDQYRKAIQKYYYATPTPVKVFPKRLEDLLEDDRFPVPVRHLRRLYDDPLTNAPLEIVRAGDDIVGVASTSTRKPFKRTGFAAPYAGFEEKDSYAEWKFVFNPPVRLRTLPAARPANHLLSPPNRMTP